MLGAEGVARAIVARMEERMPPKLDELRRRYVVDQHELPDLLEVYPTEVNVAAMGHFPFSTVVQTDTTGRLGNQTYEMDEGGEIYGLRYRMRVYVFVGGDGVPETDLQRKRMALAIRECFLGQRIVHPDDGLNYAEVDPNTIRESYSDVGPSGSAAAAQFLGAAYVEFEVSTQETLATVYGASQDDAQVALGVGIGDTRPVPPTEL